MCSSQLVSQAEVDASSTLPRTPLLHNYTLTDMQARLPHTYTDYKQVALEWRVLAPQPLVEAPLQAVVTQKAN